MIQESLHLASKDTEHWYNYWVIMQIVYYSTDFECVPTSIKSHRPVCTEQAWLSKKDLQGRQMLISMVINAACEKHARSWPCTPLSKAIFSFGFQPPNYYCLSIGRW